MDNDSAPLSEAPDPPDRPLEELRSALGADFEIVRRLGKGTMATVWLARDRALGVLVAIKVLRPGRVADETARRRFEREARAAASLAEHPNVVAVHRFGRLPDETPYLVMQYVKGRTMEERLKAEGRLPVAEAIGVLRDVASALEVAHGKGIVHRDLRPGNVLWDEDRRRALLTDFGIAAILVTSGEEVTRLTKTGQLVGNPRYLSPEQLMDQDLTELADVYLLGVLGYELLAGEGPYLTRTLMEGVSAHLTGTPRDLRDLRPDVPPYLAELLCRCLAREPLHRPSAADVGRVLREGPSAALGAPSPAPGKDDVAGLLQRRVPQVVALAVGVGLALIGFTSDLQGNGRLPEYSLDIALVTSAALVSASGIVAWFHGARGRQQAPAIEYWLLGIIGAAWFAASAWIVTGA